MRKRECTSGCRRPALPLQDIGPAGEVWPCCEDHREAARRARPAAHGRGSDAVDLARAAARPAVHRVLPHALAGHRVVVRSTWKGSLWLRGSP